MASEYPIELPLFRSERDSEAALVARAAAGDHDAYAALVRPHEHVAYRVAVSITGWNADAQEAVQNAYVKAYRSLRRFRRDAAFKPWLLKIVVNEARNVRRSELRHERLAERAAERHDPAAAGAEETVLAREEVATVLGALAQLSEPDRLVVALRYFAAAARRRGGRARGHLDRRLPRAPHACAPAARGVAGGRGCLSTSSSCVSARVARALDADAPAFDPVALRASARGQARRAGSPRSRVLAALAAAIAAPTAISALGNLFDVDEVPELGPIPADVAPGFGGRRAQLAEARPTIAFPLRTISSLGEPEAAYVRDDIVGGMVTVTYHQGRTRLTQWSVSDVSARAAVVPSSGAAEEITVGGLRALWIAGTARGTFTVTGADLAVHKELFDVAAGALLWQDDGVAFLLQGAGTKDDATRLAANVSPR